MDEAKVLELARQAGIRWATFDKLILAFARLVAAAEREACADIALDYEVNGIGGIADAIRSRTE